ncbi:hypothetical protein Q9233_000599 [Columba guinea]|nr:hypothetical protein Q9233_000599 [Columba guinea]
MRGRSSRRGLTQPRAVMAAVRVSALFLLLLCAAAGPARGWDQTGRVLLREVQALTLRRGQFTASRRTPAVPQLQCTGGTAGCSRVPEVVQCYNKGWDGYDVQWQCKADLENTYRFGQIEVSCEGYDYPDDPYILRGSCSLLFRLELTEEGERKVKNYGSFVSSYDQLWKDTSDSGAGAIVIIVLLVLAFGVYKLFLSNQQPQQSFGDSDGFTRPFWQSQQAPPPPGFKSSFTVFHKGTNEAFLLLFLIRAQSRSPYYGMWTDPTAAPPMSGQSSNSTQGSSSGTRTASGFGGTKRR